ncbi:MAG TPA: hypothetical protein VHE35_33350, partial [Kofleriaceae bacterium]|nr:hypothetical protein [Kofleriaceae bacterium]
LVLSAELARASERALVVRYRPVGAASWSELPFARAGDRTWEARIPAAAVVPPGLEYFLVTTSAGPTAGAAGDAATVDEVGSAAAPLRVQVEDSPGALRRGRDLARAHGRLWRLHVAVETTDYGTRHLGDTGVNDRYDRIDADIAYRLLRYPLEELRFGYTRLKGEVPNAPRALPAACADDPAGTACRLDAGYKLGGWFELGLAPVEGVRLDLRGLALANQAGAAFGARGELRVGVADANHLALGVEYQQGVGTTGFFRLGWLARVRTPMAVTVEVTDLPASLRTTGVRLLYDIFYPLPSGLRVGARVGYAARDQLVGGPTGGLSASFDF